MITGWLEQIKFGLFFGLGFICAYGLLKLILWVIGTLASGAGHAPILP